jgi:hypothetical protein
VKRPARRRLLGRILRPARPEEAIDEVNDLFARAVHVRAVSEQDVLAIFHRFGVEIEVVAHGQRERLYRDYLYHCLADRQLSDEELWDLRHLERVLHLDTATVELMHRRVAREVYSRSVDEVLADEQVDESERRFLAQLREHLEVPSGIADNILEMKQRQRAAKSPPSRPGQA